MGENTNYLTPDEMARLKECAVEPIHIPGSIQPHGALIAVDAITLEIQYVSANVLEMFGVEPNSLLGKSVEMLIGENWLRDVTSQEEDRLANPYFVEIGDKRFDVIIHRSGSSIIVEFEIMLAWNKEMVPNLNRVIRRISATNTEEALRECAVRELKNFLDFDRVVIYHFYPDGHGEVVAEDRVPELEPYLHQHFPASDIPAQARALYLKKASQLIATSDYTPVPLLATKDATAVQPLDLSQAELRSISPHHLHYMRNMGVSATVSLSLVHEGQLIGMITCSSQTPRVISYVYRRACEIIAAQVTLQLGALAQRRHLERQLTHQNVRADLVRQIVSAGDISEGLCSGNVTMLDLMSADGAMACIGGNIASVGGVPNEVLISALVKWVSTLENPLKIVSESLESDNPELTKILPLYAGLVMCECGPPGDFLAWFRLEHLHSINWLGAPSLDNRDTPFSPRNSFATWRQSVTGKSEPWSDDDIAQIGELIRDLDGVRAQQAAAADLIRAVEVQRALQPKDIAPSPGFEVAGTCIPARSVGGDFYDWYGIPEGVVITIGDVMGKGVGAGMIASAVRTSLRAERENPDPNIAVERCSTMLAGDLAEAATFATLFHARLNSVTGEISYTDAGHGLSMILRRAGDWISLSDNNFPIGFDFGSKFSKRLEILHPGDMLISFSDGVLDMYEDTRESMEAIADLARQAATPQALVDSIKKLAGQIANQDDITVVVARRREVRSDSGVKIYDER